MPATASRRASFIRKMVEEGGIRNTYGQQSLTVAQKAKAAQRRLCAPTSSCRNADSKGGREGLQGPPCFGPKRGLSLGQRFVDSANQCPHRPSICRAAGLRARAMTFFIVPRTNARKRRTQKCFSIAIGSASA